MEKIKFLNKLSKIYSKNKNALKTIAGKTYRFTTMCILYPFIYNYYRKQPIFENKIIFVESRCDHLSNSLSILYDNLVTNYNFDIYKHYLREDSVSKIIYIINCCSMIKAIANAKYIFISDSLNSTSHICIRCESIITQLWHGCGAFKKFGYSQIELKCGAKKEDLINYPFAQNLTYVTVSSPEVVWAYSQAMHMEDQTDHILPIGISRTDVFFDETFIRHSRKKFEKIFPHFKEKKIILYAPSFREYNGIPETTDTLSIPLFYKHLSDQYILIIKHHPLIKNLKSISQKYQNFAMDFSELMDISELLCIVDICISDYSSLIFEYSLFERPMLFFAYDLEKYKKDRGFYYEYEEFVPGPVFIDNMSMIQYIKQISYFFDKQRVTNFKDKFMSSCDGNSTTRILQKVFQNALTKYKK